MTVGFLEKKNKEIKLVLIIVYVIVLLILKSYEWSFYICTIVLAACLSIHRLWYHKQKNVNILHNRRVPDTRMWRM